MPRTTPGYTELKNGDLAPLSDQDVAIWQRRIQHAKDHRRQVWDDRARQSIAFYRGDQWSGLNMGIDLEDQITVNLTANMINVKVAQVRVANPDIYVRPRRGEMSEDVAWVNERYLSYLWEQQRISRDIDRVILDVALTGIGVIKEGYQRTTVEKKIERTRIDSSGDTKIELPPEAKGLSRTELDSLTSHGPWGRRLDPQDVWFDPEATDIEECTYIILRSSVPLYRLRNAKRYYNLEGVTTNAADGKQENGEEPYTDAKHAAEDDSLRTSLYEIWDITSRRVIFFAGHGVDLKNVRVAPWKIGLDKFPITVFMFQKDPKFFYPRSDVDMLKELQISYNVLNSLGNQHVRYFSSRIYLAQAASLDPATRDEIASARTGGVYEVMPGKDNQKALHLLPAPPMMNDIPGLMRMVEHQMELISGTANYQRAGMEQNVRTAAQTDATERWSHARTGIARAMIIEGCKDVLEKMARIARRYADPEEIDEICGRSGSGQIFKEQPDEEYDILMRCTEGVPQTPEQERKEKIQLLEILVPVADKIGYDLRDHITEVLRATGFGLERPWENFLPQAPQQAMPMGVGPQAPPGAAPGLQPGMEGPPPEGMAQIMPLMAAAAAQGGQQ